MTCDVTINGKTQTMLAYCLNPKKAGADAGQGVGGSGYSVQVLPMDANEEDKNTIMMMQGVLVRGGYLGYIKGDNAKNNEIAESIMDPYDPTRKLYNDRFEAYAITKYALWTLAELETWRIADWGVNTADFPDGTYTNASGKKVQLSYLLKSLQSIYGAGTNWTGFNDVNLYLAVNDPDGDGNPWQEDGGERFMEFLPVAGKTGDNRSDIKMADTYTLAPKNLPAGFHLARANGSKISGTAELNKGEAFRVVAEKNADISAVKDDTEIATVTGKLQTYPVLYGKADATHQNYALIPMDSWEDISTAVMIQMEQTELYEFVIRKEDETGKGLANAEFEVTDAAGNLLKTAKTTSSGNVKVSMEDPGTYYVQEVKAPSGYAMDTSKHPVTVTGKEDTPVTLTIVNSKSAALKILKLSSYDDEPLSGAVFEVQNIATGWNTEVVTGSNGMAIVNGAVPGDYRVTELEPPANYKPSQNPVQTIKLEPDKTGQLIFKNEPNWTTVKLKKTVEGTGEPIAHVVFEFRRRDGADTQSFETDEKGEITARLVPDWYTVTEKSVPENVVLDPTPHSVQLLPGKTAELAYTNRLKPNLTILKVDDDTEEPLAGAVIEVKYSDGSDVGDGNCGRGPGIYKTGADGKVELSNLPDGASIAVVELEAPLGYLVDELKHVVKVTAGHTSVITLRDKKRPGLYLRKIDADTLLPILGATFRIRVPDIPGSEKEYQTNDQGVIFLPDLDVTALVVEEIRSAPGYILNDKPITVQLEPGKRKDIVVKNQSKPGLRILKTDEEGRPIDGVTIRVYRQDNSVVGEYETEDGVIFIPNLAAATYVLEEISCPPEFILDTKKKIITLEEGKVGQVVFVNRKVPVLEIIKLDSITKSPLAGVTIKISEAQDREIGHFQTDSEGRILISEGLNPGMLYEIEEAATLPGYILSTEIKQITLEPSGKTTVYLENTAKSPLYILKTDAKTGKPVPGVKFRVEKANGELIAEVVTSSTGYAAVPDIEPGYVTVRELSVPSGYELNPMPQTVLVVAGKPTILSFENAPYGSLLIRKLDAKDSTPLAGATFLLETMEGTRIGEYTTTKDGTVTIPSLEPELAVKVSEIIPPKGYTISEAAKSIVIKPGETVTLTFKDDKIQGLTIQKKGSDGKPVPGVTFRITKQSGEFVAEVTSNENGLAVLPEILPGYYVISEISVPDGVLLNESPQFIEIKAGEPATVVFVNDYRAGIRILKTVKQTGEPLCGVKFRITRVDGGLIGEYTTGQDGSVFVPLEPQTVIVTEVSVPEGYSIDSTPRTIDVKANEPTAVSYENERLSGIRIRKVDADTGRGIYGVRIMIKDRDNRIIGEYTTDHRGCIDLEDSLPDGWYKLEEIEAAPGYELDTRIKTVKIEKGKTKEIRWENSSTKGQIQVIKKSMEENPITGLPEDSLLEGAVFEIVRADSGKFEQYITSDFRGVAASELLPLGRYLVREVTPPAFYAVNPKTFEVWLKVQNDVVRVEVLDKNVELGVTVQKTGNSQVSPGAQMRYDFSSIQNSSNTPLDNFYWHDSIPTEAVRLDVIHTGVWSQNLTYSVMYKTNRQDYRVLASNLFTTQSYDLQCSASALGLASGEYVTDFRFEFGQVHAGFHETSRPMILVTVLPNLPGGYRFANRTDAGGKYLDKWQTAQSTWVTTVYGPVSTPSYPKTGY